MQTRNQQTQTLANYLPGGRVFGAKNTAGRVDVTDASISPLGDGVSTAFFPDPHDNAIDKVVQAVYKTDWQGKQLQYATPRTNYLLRSSELDVSGVWTRTGLTTVTPNVVTAPDGTVTADKLVEDTSNGAHRITQTPTVLSTIPDNTIVMFSVFAKPAERGWLRLVLVDRAGTFNLAYFDVVNGAIGVTGGAVGASITAAANGFYRCALFVSIASGATSPNARIQIASANNVVNYLGDGVSGLYAWGAQLEMGFTLTSFIPTTASTVTVTDYALDQDQSIVFSSPPDVNALISWDGYYTRLSTFRALLHGLAGEMVRVDAALYAFRDDINPATTLYFLDEWEAALGIPDGCFSGAGSVTERRRDILIKLASLGIQTAADLVALGPLFGINISVEAAAPYAIFPMKFPIVLLSSAKEARFTIVVNYPAGSSISTFPFTFPIIFGTVAQTTLQCLFEKLKPANCNIIYRQVT